MGHNQDFKFRYTVAPRRPLLLPPRLESADISDLDVLMAVLSTKPIGHVSREGALSTVKLLTAFIMAAWLWMRWKNIQNSSRYSCHVGHHLLSRA